VDGGGGAVQARRSQPPHRRETHHRRERRPPLSHSPPSLCREEADAMLVATARALPLPTTRARGASARAGGSTWARGQHGRGTRRLALAPAGINSARRTRAPCHGARTSPPCTPRVGSGKRPTGWPCACVRLRAVRPPRGPRAFGCGSTVRRVSTEGVDGLAARGGCRRPCRARRVSTALPREKGVDGLAARGGCRRPCRARHARRRTPSPAAQHIIGRATKGCGAAWSTPPHR
jgi:hypothetical protein